MAVLVERDHIGIFGKMNSGKSSVLNLLSQQKASIVDDTPGTTADTKVIKQEIHGLGPVKFYDTAGIDETSALGEKKKRKVINVLKECDLVLLIIDPSTQNFSPEKELLNIARQQDKQLLIVYNIFTKKDTKYISRIKKNIPELKDFQSVKIKAIEVKYRSGFLKFILNNFRTGKKEKELLPFITSGQFYVLVIPMDEQSPEGRYLRPQAMTGEFITRKRAFPVSYRLDLKKVKSCRKMDVNAEKMRFQDFINSLGKKPAAVITDSQAAGTMARWLKKDILLTTFSIVMINYFSRGKLIEFARGMEAVNTLDDGKNILIVEACNHSRIAEDIGTVQIPRYVNKKFPGVNIEYNFGREFLENNEFEKYNLVIHCGGCMISEQKLQSRLKELSEAGVPYTNYGIFLSYMSGESTLSRVLLPWGIHFKQNNSKNK